MRVGYVFPLLFLLLMQPMAAQYRLTPNPGSIPGASLLPPAERGDVSTDSLTAQLEPTAGEKLLYLAGAALGMGLFDYVGFNLVRDNEVTTPIYRVVQGLTQIGVSWLLYEKVGLPTAIAFNLVWWTWGLDALFYGYTELFNVGGSWRDRGTFNREVNANQVRWASWTPVGIAQGMDPDKAIAGDALIAQVLVGAALAVTITVSF